MAALSAETVFISYARMDGAEVAERLYTDLKTAGVTAWLDVHNISAGDDWNTAIDRALETVETVIVVLTPSAVESQQVKSEWNYALDLKKEVLPVVAQDCEVPRRLRIINYVDIRGGKYDANLSTLLRLAGVDGDDGEIPANPQSTARVIPIHNFYTRRWVLAALLGLCCVTALLYLNSTNNQTIVAGILMILTATLLLVLGVRRVSRYIANRSSLFFAYTMDTADVEELASATQDFHNSIYHTKMLTIFGLLYGLAAALAIVYLSNERLNNPSSVFFLFAFLFFVNFATGIVVYGLYRIFKTILQTGRTVDFDFWERNNPATKFIMNISGQISLYVCAYVSLCINSVYFLDVSLNMAVQTYALFGGIFALAAYIVPTLPLRARFNRLKNDTLQQVDLDLQRAYKLMVGKRGDSSRNINTAEVDRLIGLRNKIDRVELWPYSWRSVLVVAIIVTITVSPVIISFLV